MSELRKTGFDSVRDGMPGNDDLGAQSAWYVFSALGFFPVSPSEAGLAITSPMFQAATMWIDSEPVRLTTDIDPTDAPLIKNMQIDGQDYGRSWMSADTLKNAQNISFTLSRPQPSGQLTPHHVALLRPQPPLNYQQRPLRSVQRTALQQRLP